MSDTPEALTNHNTLTIQGLCKYFAGLHALDGVSFTLARGEILGLIGPNGSGKTTLINVVTGLLPATSGQVFVDGAEITNKKPYQIAHAGLARTFQTIRLFRELTVLENVEVAAVSMGLSRRAARERALLVLEEIGISRWAEHARRRAALRSRAPRGGGARPGDSAAASCSWMSPLPV